MHRRLEYTSQFSGLLCASYLEESRIQRSIMSPVNGDSITLVASASAGAEGPIPPKTVEQKLARKNELKAKSTLMLAIPDEHLLGIKDAKTLWEAIKTRNSPANWKFMVKLSPEDANFVAMFDTDDLRRDGSSNAPVAMLTNKGMKGPWESGE
ncbi:hypothetical protein Tco_0666067 [Tanacetum coccineum]